jgi:hypothetical protein
MAGPGTSRPVGEAWLPAGEPAGTSPGVEAFGRRAVPKAQPQNRLGRELFLRIFGARTQVIAPKKRPTWAARLSLEGGIGETARPAFAVAHEALPRGKSMRRLLYGPIIGLLMMFGRSAMADASPPPPKDSGSTRASARKDPLAEGRAAVRTGRWAKGEAILGAVLGDPDASVNLTALQRAEALGHLGLCELELKKYRNAAEHLYDSYFGNFDIHLDRSLEIRFMAAFKQARLHIGQIYISVDPSDAQVFLDGKLTDRGRGILSEFVEPGTHTIRARLTGYGDASQTIEVPVGTTGTAILKLSQRSETIVRTQEPKERKTATITKGGTPEPLPAAREPAPGAWSSWPGTLRFAGVAVTAATASLGAVFMIRARATDGDIKEQSAALEAQTKSSSGCSGPAVPAVCSDLSSLRSERDQFAALGTALVITSGIVGTATVVSLFTGGASGRSEPKKDRVAIAVAAAPRQAGIVVFGTW